MSRYDQLLHAIDLFKPKTICEIGTWNGDNAIRMIQRAGGNVMYIGYDLFEGASDETDKAELNVKAHNSREAVLAKIKAACQQAEVYLIAGNTRETLKSVTVDFAYIDGGHSIETIEKDYNAVKNSRVIIFDDYYIEDDKGGCPDIDKYGCNTLIGQIGGLVLPDKDPVKGGGYTQMVLKC